MEFDGVKIKKDMKLDDFKKYAEEGLISIDSDFGNGQGVIRFINKVKRNDILARIKIEIHKWGIVVYIYTEINVGEDLISIGKKWLTGMIADEKLEKYTDRISVTYNWGNITAMYMPDRDYGIVGGDIQIAYEKEK